MPISPSVAIATHPSAEQVSWRKVVLPRLFARPRNGNSQEFIQSLACPTTSLCVALGSSNGDGFARMWRSANPTGGASAWNLREADEFGSHDDGCACEVVCPSIRLCIATEHGHVSVLTNPARKSARWRRSPIAGASATFSLSCPSARLCVALTDGGLAMATSSAPAYGGRTWTIRRVPGRHGFRVSCPSATFCGVSGSDAKGFAAYVTTNPAAGPAAWQPVVTPFGPRSQIEALSCSSRALCVGVAGLSAWAFGLQDAAQR